MKKFYSLIAVAMLSLTTAMAQDVAPVSKNFAAKKHVSANIKTVGTVKIEGVKRDGTTVKPMFKAPMTRVATRALAANQKYYGAYSSDAYETESGNGLGKPSVPGDLKVATFLPSGYFSNVADSKIVGMRFALTNPAIVKNAFIYAEDMEGNISEVASKSFRTLGNTSAGWTEVTFNAPVTVDFSKINGLMIGYTYTQVASGVSARPISVVDEGDFIAESYMYGDLGQGTGWYDVGLMNYGNLSVQLLLENDKFLTNDAVVNEMLIEKNWYKAGDEMKYAALVKNFGAGTIGNVVLGTAIDGVETASTITLENVNSGSAAQGSMNLPANIALGKHTLKVFVKSMDGGTSTGNTDDDYLEKTFYVYSKEVARQKNLIEQFTSQWCTNCPDGTTNLENFVATRNNDIAWIAIHGNMGNDYKDDFYLEENDYLMYFQNATFYPSASFNRTVAVNDGTTVFGINVGSSATTEQINEYFNSILDYTTAFTPALATVNISGSYDEATRKLDVTVSGNGADAAKVLVDMGINVFLTENGVIANQGFSDGYMHEGYTHNNVSRGALTNVLGDDIKWTGDNYENTYSITLPAEWNADNMEVIAFMSTKIVNGFDINNECVTNANSVKLTNITTGIKGVYGNGAEAVETARYNAAGQMITAPQKGLNIIKMSNGETRKVVVK